LTRARDGGYAAGQVICKFEEDLAATITFKTGGDTVEGRFFNPVNLRKITK
jgi:hypothetical protein